MLPVDELILMTNGSPRYLNCWDLDLLNICATKTNIGATSKATRDKAPKLIGPMPHNIKYIYVQLSPKHGEDNASVANMLSGNSEEAVEAHALASHEVLIRFIFKFILQWLYFSLAQDLRTQLSHPDASDQG